MKKIIDIKRFTYNEVNVDVKIDYVNNKISLVDMYNGHINNKKWVFADRGAEYMKGWLDILDAMKYAIEEAKKLYDEETKLTDEEIDKSIHNFINNK